MPRYVRIRVDIEVTPIASNEAWELSVKGTVDCDIEDFAVTLDALLDEKGDIVESGVESIARHGDDAP